MVAMTTPRTTPISQSLYESATNLIPGGVNSPARAWGSVGGTPLFFTSGSGSKITDADGNSYIDYVCSWGPLILGHAHPDVTKAAQEATARGASFGAPTEIEVDAAKLIVDAVPSIEMVRFVNSGTEATMSAMRLARAATGRDMILKFDGGYHGHDDALLVRAGSGLATSGIADSAGVNPKLAADTLVAPYNDLDAVQRIFEAHPERIACVIIEPIGGNMGVVPADPDFLQGLRRITRDDGCLLIFDEVISGFRVAYGGAQTLYGVEPDITCLGKIIGGGFPVGAYGASRELMSHVAPLGPMYQAGTLSGNPVAMAAGAKTIQLLSEPDTYQTLKHKTEHLAQGLQQAIDESETPATINHTTGMLTLFLGIPNEPAPFAKRKGARASEAPRAGDAQTPPLREARTQGVPAQTSVYDMTTASTNDRQQFTRFFHNMLAQGIYLPPSPFEAWFVSLAHSDEDIEATIRAVRESL
ncbi:MAG: glutamate-1-semialdehyde 2,1-aminomutase [Chloroflexi bacterium]|nr:glutamate-1-semialdehyde 2,1-aminomutase [Chloroflexota bacterium]MYK61804.1 glutamate-1-semialdehyde 2,1-aminomutase [Chloroflexota bacterium]